MIPFCSVSQTLAWEHAAAQVGIPQSVLMENAGQALFQELLCVANQVGHTCGLFLFLAGPGNNGGDGLVCAEKLLDQGHAVRLYTWRRTKADDPLYQKLANRAEFANAESDTNFQMLRNWLADCRWIVDCLLGTGVNRPIAGLLADLMATVRDGLTELHFLCAADCPSGANCDTGAVDPCTLPVDLTVMFGTAKRGLYQSPALEYSGRTVVADIGLLGRKEAPVIGWGLEPKDLSELLPHRPEQSHKGTFGKVFCIVGSQRYPGAAHLSARSAALSGAGLVCAAVPASVQPGLVSGMADVTFLPYQDELGTASPAALTETVDEALKYSAVLLGCGLVHNSRTTEFVEGFLAALRNYAGNPIPLVLDADALNCLATLEKWPRLLPPSTILTPHLAEMGRLCDLPLSDIASQVPELAREMAQTWECTLVLKGSQTWIGTPEGRLFGNLTPNSALATAGTGDVLAGQIAGLLAQGQKPVEAAKGAVLIHSLAGQSCALEVGQAGTTALDVLSKIPSVLHQYAPVEPRHLRVMNDYLFRTRK